MKLNSQDIQWFRALKIELPEDMPDPAPTPRPAPVAAPSIADAALKAACEMEAIEIHCEDEWATMTNEDLGKLLNANFANKAAVTEWQLQAASYKTQATEFRNLAEHLRVAAENWTDRSRENYRLALKWRATAVILGALLLLGLVGALALWLQ